MAEQAEYLMQENALLSERLAALEFALESMDWRLLTTQAEQEFSREGLRIITELARVMYLKNPLIQRGVNVQRLYVWGQGWSVRAQDVAINAVLQAFMDDRGNAAELTGHQGRMQKEVELSTDGNLFLVCFVNPVTGRVRVRSMPFEEVEEKVCNPEDGKECWYYRRCWTQTSMDGNGVVSSQALRAYYPDLNYNPVNKPTQIGNITVHWDRPVLHIKTGGFSNWKFGVSEVYAAIDWAKAYKEFLEDWASIVRAYRKFAFQLTTPGGKSSIAAAKAKLSTTSSSSSGETNPAPVAGSTFIAGEGVNLQPVRTSGATVAAEDGRRILLMVAAAVGLPETFFGDVSVGTLATANSLDRPTELAMKDRQALWADIFGQVFDFVLRWAVKAPRGELRGLGQLVVEQEEGQAIETVAWNADVDAHIDIDFPPIVSGNVQQQVAAIISAATLDGKQPAGTMDLETVARLLLTALGEDDIDEILADLFDENGQPVQPVQPHPSPPQGEGTVGGQMAPARPQSEALMVEAVRELRDSLLRLRSVDNKTLSGERRKAG